MQYFLHTNLPNPSDHTIHIAKWHIHAQWRGKFSCLKCEDQKLLLTAVMVFLEQAHFVRSKSSPTRFLQTKTSVCIHSFLGRCDPGSVSVESGGQGVFTKALLKVGGYLDNNYMFLKHYTCLDAAEWKRYVDHISTYFTHESLPPSLVCSLDACSTLQTQSHSRT